MKCNCKKEINISQADINIRKNTIDITITREPDTPLISELRKQIAELQELGLKFQDIDRKLADILEEMDLVSKTALLEMLQDYAKTADLSGLKTELKEWANDRFIRKIYITKEAYENLSEEEKTVNNGNVMFIIIENN